MSKFWIRMFTFENLYWAKVGDTVTIWVPTTFHVSKSGPCFISKISRKQTIIQCWKTKILHSIKNISLSWFHEIFQKNVEINSFTLHNKAKIVAKWNVKTPFCENLKMFIDFTEVFRKINHTLSLLYSVEKREIYSLM